MDFILEKLGETCIAIVFILSIMQTLEHKIQNINDSINTISTQTDTTNIFNIYYEYDIIGNDTICIDTINLLIK